MAKLGFRTFDEMVGRADMLEFETRDHWKARSLDFSSIFYLPPTPSRVSRRCTQAQEHGLDQALDHKLMKLAAKAIDCSQPVTADLPIHNVHRSVGAMISGEIVRRSGPEGLPDGTLRFNFKGSAGQSFGAFLAPGVTLSLEGEANDFVGKGLSGGRLMVFPSRASQFSAERNIVIGNVALYGATSGEAFFSGVAGERFAVRNSGATAVVEGVGDHGCEYMTRGTVVVLGQCGRNFAAGMSGGIAYVHDPHADFAEQKCNRAGVDLDPLSAEDMQRLQLLIARHFEFTRSRLARQILENWSESGSRFVKVFPHDYKRVLGVTIASAPPTQPQRHQQPASIATAG
jgi:glutamate synthase domain-containing protein 3